jgi:protocatechuate 3,4-dioxygenase beta subunit
MKFSTQAASLFLGVLAINPALAHPERLTKDNVANELVGRSSNKCAAQIEARKEAMKAKRAESLFQRRQAEAVRLNRRSDAIATKRDVYSTIQNDTCVLAPETVWGPYAIDEEIYRHDVREGQSGVDLYLDIGVLDIDTCEPLPDAYLTIWHCNSTGTYSGFTGIDPDTSDLLDGYTKSSDGTTDQETFLRGVMSTNTEGIAEFLTLFPGYYITRSTHIHLTVQTNVSSNSSESYSYSSASVQHVGQLFFTESLINSVYALSPYSAHLSTLNRTTNDEDSVYATSNTDGYSSIISVELLGETIADGLVGYITVGVNTSASVVTSGGSINPIGVIPTVSVASSVRAAATAVDVADGYTVKF